jgi:TonB-linked SusC/RagA family outer membrane protein
MRFFTLIGFVLLVSGVFAQNAGIKGLVKDMDGTPVPLATVAVEGTIQGAMTDDDGKFSISGLSSGTYNLIITAFSFEKTELRVDLKDNEVREVAIELPSIMLDEVVMIGYGTTLKRDLTGSVSTVKAEDLENAVTPTFDQALQGKAAGVQITAANGVAGGGQTKIQIRGTNSIAAGGGPLIVVDGVPISNQDISANVLGAGTNGLADLNIDDIESVDVLKDASAAAIYGARGANGVIIITTKKGREGGLRFDFNYKTGLVKETNRLDLLSAEEHLALRDQFSIENTGSPESKSNVIGVFDGVAYSRADADSFAAVGGSDWIQQMLQTGVFQEANVSASGGNDKTKVYLSGIYRDEESFLKGNSFQKVAGRMNVETNAHPKVLLGANVGLTYSLNDRVATGDNGGLGWAQQIPTYIPVFQADGSYFNEASNPLWYLENRSFVAKRLRSLSNVYAELKILPDLRFRSNFGLDFTDLAEDEYQARNEAANSDAYAWERTSNILNWNSSYYFTFDRAFGEDHHLNLVAGSDLQKTQINGFGIYGSGFSNAGFTNPQQAVNQALYSYQTGNAIISYYARGAYKLKNKYLFGFTARTDGSSRFSEDYRYGFFPSLSVGWIVSDEAFMKNLKVLNYLKLRSSYGITGNDNIGDFTRYGLYSVGLGYAGSLGLYPSTLANESLKWEKARMLDVSTEFGLFENRISGSFTYFFKQSSDLLLPIQLPTSSGFATMTVNAGVVNNWGTEIMLNSYNITGKHFEWSTNLNLSIIRNKVVDVAGLPPDAFESGQPGEGRVIEGYPVGQSFVVRFAGIQQEDGELTRYNSDGSVMLDDLGNPVTVNVQAGEALYYDTNGNLMAWGVDNNGTPTVSDDDINRFTGTDFYGNRVPVGSPVPKFYAGLGNTLRYKGFELNFLFNTVWGHTIYDDPAKNQIGMLFNFAQRPEILDAYSETNPSNEVPSLTSNVTPVNSDRFLYDASFIRLRSLTLSYKLPTKICNRIKLGSVQVYATGFNLWTWTRYPGWDPEVLRNVPANSQQENISFSGPSWQTPQAKIFLMGVKMGI